MIQLTDGFQYLTNGLQTYFAAAPPPVFVGDRIVTIGPSGRDYTSISTALSAQTDHTELEDNLVFVIDAGTYAPPNIGGCAWSTSATHRIIIRAANFHTYTRATGVIIDSSENWQLFYTDKDYLTFDGIAFTVTASEGIEAAMLIWSSYVEIINCFVYDCLICGGLLVHDAGTIDYNKYVNTVAVNCQGGSGLGPHYNTDGATDLILYNCVVLNCLRGIQATGYRATYVKNCYVGGCGTNYMPSIANDVPTFTTSYSPDGSCGSSVMSLASAGFLSTTAGSENIFPVKTSQLRGAGTDLSSDALYPFNTDGNNYTITGSWNIGPVQPRNRVVSIMPSGGMYTLLSLAIAGVSNFCTSDDDIIFEISGTWSAIESGSITLQNFTTSVNHRVIVRTDSANRASTSWSNSKYRLSCNSTSYGAAISISCQYCVIDGLQITVSEDGAGGILMGFGGDNSVAKNCYVDGAGRGGYGLRAGYNNMGFVNCIVTRFGWGNVRHTGTNSFIYNSISVNGSRGIRTDDGSVRVVNCYSANNSTANYESSAGTTYLTCASPDGSDSTTQIPFTIMGTTGTQFASITAGSENLFIGKNSSLRGIGTNLNADSQYPFNTDMNGYAITTWNIGPLNPRNRRVSISPSGANFTSLPLALAGVENFTSSDDDMYFDIIGTWSSTDTGQALVQNFDSTAYHRIYIKTSSSNRSSSSWSNSKYRFSYTTDNSGSGIHVLVPYVEIDGLQVRIDVSGSGINVAAENCIVRNCFANINGYSYGFYVGFFANVGIINCYSVNGTTGFGLQNAGNNCFVYNSTAINNSRGFRVNNYLNHYLKNCYSGNNSVSDYDVEGSNPSLWSTCYSEDGTGTTSIVPITDCGFTSITAGSENLTITGISPLIGSGTDLRSDSIYPVTADINGNVIQGAYASIGPVYVNAEKPKESVIFWVEGQPLTIAQCTNTSVWTRGSPLSISRLSETKWVNGQVSSVNSSTVPTWVNGELVVANTTITSSAYADLSSNMVSVSNTAETLSVITNLSLVAESTSNTTTILSAYANLTSTAESISNTISTIATVVNLTTIIESTSNSTASISGYSNLSLVAESTSNIVLTLSVYLNLSTTALSISNSVDSLSLYSGLNTSIPSISNSVPELSLYDNLILTALSTSNFNSTLSLYSNLSSTLESISNSSILLSLYSSLVSTLLSNSNTSVALFLYNGLTFTGTSESNVNSTLLAYSNLSSAFESSSNIVSNLILYNGLLSTLESTSDSSGTLLKYVNLAFTSASISNSSGVLATYDTMLATMTSISNGSYSLSLYNGLVFTSESASNTTSTLTQYGNISTTIESISNNIDSLTNIIGLSSTAISASGGVWNLDVIEGGSYVELSSTMGSTSISESSVSLIYSLQSTILSTSNEVGTLTRYVGLIVNAQSTSATAYNLVSIVSLLSTITSISNYVEISIPDTSTLQPIRLKCVLPEPIICICVLPEPIICICVLPEPIICICKYNSARAT